MKNKKILKYKDVDIQSFILIDNFEPEEDTNIIIQLKDGSCELGYKYKDKYKTLIHEILIKNPISWKYI